MFTSIAFALTLQLAAAATIADIVRNDPRLSALVPQLASNPSWGTVPAGTLLAAPGSTSRLFTSTAVDHLVTHYLIMTDDNGSLQVVFDNYTPGNANPEIHIRFGTGEVLTSAQIKADNGWVYILQGPIPPESSVTDTLAAQSSNAFANAIKSAGLASYINGLKGYTVFAPSDAAWAAAAGRLASLTPDQVKGTILYHVLSESVVSTALSNRNAQTLLQGQTIAFGVDGENWTLNGGQGKVTTSDFFSAGGVIHLIDSVLTPPAFPAGPIVIPGAGSTTTTAAPVTTATAVTSTTAMPSNTTTAAPTATGSKAPNSANQSSTAMASMLAAILAFFAF